MNITYTNKITVEQFNALRISAGWRAIQIDLAQKGLENSAFIIVANENEKVVGMAKVITDYGYTVIITDVVVLPQYQGNGIGKVMVSKLMEYINDNIAVGQTKLIYLMAAKGKEDFYKKYKEILILNGPLIEIQSLLKTQLKNYPKNNRIY